MQEFDLDLMQEFAVRQKKDAERIDILCRAVGNLINENAALKQELAALKPPPSEKNKS